ncbi:unnamed protein product, partial [Nesidiocoris tenuis]
MPHRLWVYESGGSKAIGVFRASKVSNVMIGSRIINNTFWFHTDASVVTKHVVQRHLFPSDTSLCLEAARMIST